MPGASARPASRRDERRALDAQSHQSRRQQRHEGQGQVRQEEAVQRQALQTLARLSQQLQQRPVQVLVRVCLQLQPLQSTEQAQVRQALDVEGAQQVHRQVLQSRHQLRHQSQASVGHGTRPQALQSATGASERRQCTLAQHHASCEDRQSIACVRQVVPHHDFIVDGRVHASHALVLQQLRHLSSGQEGQSQRVQVRCRSMGDRRSISRFCLMT